jgi:predicted acylesterase/phospholipase RssA
MIYTLYSFKGGVGRSMALANLGAYFCRKGLRVVMIDWDLEAPGLENYFYSKAEGTGKELAGSATRPGLIDLLIDYKKKFPGLAIQVPPDHGPMFPDPPGEAAVSESLAPDVAVKSSFSEESVKEAEEVAILTMKHRERRKAAKKQPATASSEESRQPISFADILESSLPSIEPYLQPIEMSSPGGLWLLGAGARSPEAFGKYADAVQDFDWLEFIASYEGKAYLEWLRGKLSALADVVLIDSRTGVTEMGGICTRQMADAVVAFCAPNNQNIEGVARIVSSFETSAARKARYDRHLQVLVIPTRLDDSESGLLGEFSTLFTEKFEGKNLIPGPLENLDRPFWHLQIPYIPKYNFGERLVISPAPPPLTSQARPDPPTEKLIQAYENIALHLAVLAPEQSPLRMALQSEIASAFPQLLPHRTPRMTASVPGNWVKRPEAAAKLKEALLLCARAPKGGRLAIWGQAGTGKTTLLARVCEDDEIAAAFPDGIVWLTIEGAWGPDRVQEFLRTQFALPRGGGQAALTHALEDRKFLFVVDDVWTADQLDTVFEFGPRASRVIVTRDLATASQFADIVITVGNFSPAESLDFLKMPSPISDEIRADTSLNWLLDWPLGASLFRAAVERQSAQSNTPEFAWSTLRGQLQRSGLRLLDQPETTGRNGSLDRSLRDSLSRLPPEARKLLTAIAAQGEKGVPVKSVDLSGPIVYSAVDRKRRSSDRPPARWLVDLALAVEDGETLRAHEIVYRWLIAQNELTEDTDGKRRRERKETLELGYAILRGRAASLDDMERIAYRAKDMRAFSLARKLLALARQHSDAAALSRDRKLHLLQQHALCTYKDDDIVADERLTGAFQILNAGDLQDASPSQETLGLAGSIYKQWWRYTGQRRDLEHSLGFYQRGASADLSGDFGYTRINAAFVLDLLAKLELNDFPKMAQLRRRQAAVLREEIAARLPELASQTANAWLKGEWWYGATMAEALFGLGRYSEARYWLREALTLDPPAWQFEATARQMSALARAQDVDTTDDSDAWLAIAMLVGDSTDALRAMTAGKFGLALSGGGFRASLFHIGVLARLAELDILRHVEVLSCVSGGSIIGAHYYLEVRRLLQEKRDREIRREDYVEIVKRIERDFLAGVQMNLRGRLFAGWIANLLSIVVPGYTRTKYLGELLEKHIYSRVADGGGSSRLLNHLQIAPKDEGQGQDFNPKLDNWRRGAKAPILLLNTTTLNTGHVWQFAVNWMGEPPISTNSSVDCNDLLRRMYYTEAPVGHKDVRLGLAVSASACVPGLFDPVDMEGLFPRRSVRLVDGGVHDNQGVSGLLEQECSVLLVSDASGQMTSERKPGADPVTVFKRTQDISMARIREAEFKELATLRRSSALGGLMFLHLKKDLDIQHVDWVGCQDPYDSSANPGRARRGATLTAYGMPKDIQGQLAGLRTDLDTFSNAEAYALMLSGYRMTASDFALSLSEFSSEVAREAWDFLAIETTVDRATDYEPEHDRLKEVLRTGSQLPFKVWRLRPLASILALVPAAIFFIVVAATELWLFRLAGITLCARVGRWMFLGVMGIIVLFFLLQRLRGRKSLTVIASGLGVVTVGWIVARLHLWLFDPLYRGAGAVRRRDVGRGPAGPVPPGAAV